MQQKLSKGDPLKKKKKTIQDNIYLILEKPRIQVFF